MNRQNFLLLISKCKGISIYGFILLVIVILSGLYLLFFSIQKDNTATVRLDWLPPILEFKGLLPIMGTAPDGTPPATLEDVEKLISTLRRSEFMARRCLPKLRKSTTGRKLS